MTRDKNISRQALRLYAITDGGQSSLTLLLQKVEDAILGGATIIQLREKKLTGTALLQRAISVKAVCDRRHVPLIINDDVSLALSCGASGVHLGQQDMPPAKARSLLGPNSIIGVSARSVKQARHAQDEGADYLGCGAVFTTSTKSDAAVLPLDTLSEICRSVSIPVVAIGGITQDNAIALKGSGISGIAVVSAIFGKPDVRTAAESLRRLSDSVSGGSPYD